MAPRCQILPLHPHEARDAPAALLMVAMLHSPARPKLVAPLTALLDDWRGGEGCIVHIRRFPHKPHSSCRAGHPSAEAMPCAVPLPGERVVTSHTEDAFVDTDLEAWLRRHGISHLVLAGATTLGTITTLARHAQCLGFSVTVLADACADDEMTDRNGFHWKADILHELGLTLLERQGVDILSVEELCRGC
ncbi:isochorismatase family protein [Chromohalobacter moromii]|uniref:Isochorismatase family protein n=1 Tax=Chromohalobacter moromii TaxID=2860329 RepID=A0A9X3AXF6_9GAMM|nr:isochorismatase family protein [Chromohalobacter moromii]MCK2045152.1 isochorismatase family protein [Chromohalobacter moromii]MCT8505181.1 isochorismatase family protein [Chromohalobacter moromii]